MSPDNLTPDNDKTTKAEESVTGGVIGVLLWKLGIFAVFTVSVVWVAKHPGEHFNFSRLNWLLYWLPLAVIVILGTVSNRIHRKYYKSVELKGLKGMKSSVYIGNSPYIPIISGAITTIILTLAAIMFGYLLLVVWPHGGNGPL